MTTTSPVLWMDYLAERAVDVFGMDAGPGYSDAPELQDPVVWAREKLGIDLWSKQREIAQSVRDNRRTAVRSCHDAGKSFIASVIAAWWIDTHPPGEAFIVSSAPSKDQVHAILWAEISQRHKQGNLAGRVLQNDQWKLDDGTLIGWGRKPADTDEHGFQGIHRRYVLVILDEACGIPDQLWTAVEAITTNQDSRILAIGNPDDPATEFGTVCKPGSGWSVIGISAFDTPNFTDEVVPNSLRPLLLDPEWVEDKKRRWGVESPRYLSKVLGEFPEVGDDTLISPALIEAAQRRTLDPGTEIRLGVDVARYGSDQTIIMRAEGPVVRTIGAYSKQSTTETTGRVVAAARDTEGPVEIRVDGVGVGGGVVDSLMEMATAEDRPIDDVWWVIDMQAGSGAEDPARFKNARAEWFWGLRERFQDGDIDIDPTDDELAAQLGTIKFKYTARGQVQIESKDDMKKRGLPSPDRADTLMLVTAFVPEVVHEEQVVDQYDLEPDLADFRISAY
jgi:hypothetical protein